MFYLLLFPPLVGFLINGFCFKSKNVKLSGSIASGAVLLSFFSSLVFFLKMKNSALNERTFSFSLFDWIQVSDFGVNMAFTVDPLSVVMILIITGVGFLIHVFSMGYMDHDERPAKYFSYLNFFIFNMLLLVLGDNLLVLFVGWEGVGLCSYLLIGFWFSDAAKAAAGMKAFIINRIGDAGFLLAIFILFDLFGTLSFTGILEALPREPTTLWSSPITIACLFLFVGAVGKSAQIPLYVWLPDAMAGPTPVSALIHAATMVTAGVYMIIRLNPLFLMAPNAMMVIAVVGALTALMAASIGLVQNDIKKVLAYSTVSQLGYMFLAVGVGAFSAALAHLMTHAFFKALLFLGSGSVIHALLGEQDMRHMGALKKQMPITHFSFVCGWLAIIGAPFFSGFFSKDEILWMSFHSPRGHFLLWLTGAVAAVFTAFYMTRLMAMTFWGSSRVNPEIKPHESPLSMTFALLILAFLSVFAGWLCVPHGLGSALPWHPANALEQWIHPLLGKWDVGHGSLIMEFSLMTIVMVLTAISAFVAFFFYVRKPQQISRNAKKMQPLYQLLYNKYWVDELYLKTLVQPLIQFSRYLWVQMDVKIIDRLVHCVSNSVRDAGSGLKMIQSGNLQVYALYILIGLVTGLFFLMTR